MGWEGSNISIIVKLSNIVGPKPFESRSFLLPYEVSNVFSCLHYMTKTPNVTYLTTLT